MRARLRGAVVALALVPALAAVAAGQTNRMHLGPQINYDFDLEEIGIGAQFGGDFTPRIGLHVADPADPVAAAIADDLRGEEGVVIESHDDTEEMTLAVERGTIAAGVVIPVDVEESVAAGQPAEIGFISRQDGFGPQFQSVVPPWSK